MRRITQQRMILICGIIALFMFTGCSPKVYANNKVGGAWSAKGETPGQLMYVQGKEAWRSPSAGYNVKTRNIHVLQNMADLTLREGFKYFAIGRPLAISNMDGSTMNTAEEFVDKCTPSSAQIFDVANGRCGFNGTTMWVSAIFAAYKEKPLEYLTYDAKEVKEYLIANNLYRSDSYEGISLDTMYLRSFPDVNKLVRIKIDFEVQQ